MTQDDRRFVFIKCPLTECENRAQQTATFQRTDLQRMLSQNEDIEVFGVICGHTWKLSKKEKDGLNHGLSTGAL